jgi:hypothetical protein
MVVNVSPGRIVNEGASKIAFEPIIDNEKSVFEVAYNKEDFLDKYLIMQYKKNITRETIYKEFELYEKFSLLGFSPKILYVTWESKSYNLKTQMSTRWFLTYYYDNMQFYSHEIKFLVENVDCGKNIFNYYVDDDYEDFFKNLKNFIEKIVERGYVNTDIKPGNLCINPKTKKILMIDLDPNFLKPIQTDIKPDIYVDYMLFQFFVVMVRHNKKDVKFENFFTQDRIVHVLHELIVNNRDLNGHPLKSLIYYSGIDRDYFFFIFNNYTRRDIINIINMVFEEILNNIGINLIPQHADGSLTAPLPVNAQAYNPPTYSPDYFGFGKLFGGNKTRGNKKKNNSRKRKRCKTKTCKTKTCKTKK